MTTETILTDERLIETAANELQEHFDRLPNSIFLQLARAIEQAVLQSPEVQAWKRDAERYRFIRNASCDENEPLLNKTTSEIRGRIPKDRIAPRYEDYDAGVDAAMEKQK